MQSKEILVELIEYLDLFERTVPNAHEMGLSSFLAFASSLQYPKASGVQTEMHQAAEIARHLSMLYRYSKGYLKKALQESSLLQTEEEYTYLVCLMGGDRLTKKELNARNAMEKGAGLEVIRKLRQNGLVEEKPDDKDKRSILVSITPQGRSELMKVLPFLSLAAQILVAPLKAEQRANLNHLLQFLTAKHSELIAKNMDCTLTELHDYFGSI